jgi:hypothetical protein
MGNFREPLLLNNLKAGELDSLGETVRQILFRGASYTIYRSDRGVYVHFSDDPDKEKTQRQAYILLAGQICELRYLTAQMHRKSFWRQLNAMIGRRRQRSSSIPEARPLLFDFNLAQALMLLMESEEQRGLARALAAAASGDNETKKTEIGDVVKEKLAAADSTQQHALTIANRALEMAVNRVTTDNTIRYIQTSVVAGSIMIAVLFVLFISMDGAQEIRRYLLASMTGAVGALFSVISRAQAFELKPCDDSRYNKLLAAVRVGMGAIAGPALLLFLDTLFSFQAKSVGDTVKDVPAAVKVASELAMAAVLGLVGGFAERLVPNLARSAAEKIEPRAGTPVQAAAQVAK